MIQIFYVICKFLLHGFHRAFSVSKIWSSICIQVTVLHYQINPIRLLCSFLYPICLTDKSNENDYLYVENTEVF